jgi:hypothetical protein
MRQRHATDAVNQDIDPGAPACAASLDPYVQERRLTSITSYRSDSSKTFFSSKLR